MGNRIGKVRRLRRGWRVLALLAAAAALAVGLAACNGNGNGSGNGDGNGDGGASNGDASSGGGYDDTSATNANATQVPVELAELNDSGVTGRALVVKGDDTVTISLSVTGLQPGEIHPQNVNRYPDDEREVACPTAADDTDGDGRISAAEGTAVYGPVALELLPTPTADEDGSIRFQRSFPLEASRIYNGVIVVSGAVVDGVFDPAVPAACGQLGK